MQYVRWPAPTREITCSRWSSSDGSLHCMFALYEAVPLGTPTVVQQDHIHNAYCTQCNHTTRAVIWRTLYSSIWAHIISSNNCTGYVCQQNSVIIINYYCDTHHAELCRFHIHVEKPWLHQSSRESIAIHLHTLDHLRSNFSYNLNRQKMLCPAKVYARLSLNTAFTKECVRTPGTLNEIVGSWKDGVIDTLKSSTAWRIPVCVLGGRPQIRRKHLLNVTSIALRPGEQTSRVHNICLTVRGKEIAQRNWSNLLPVTA